MRIIRHENVWADAGIHREGHMVGRAGQRIAYRDPPSRYVARCLADTEWQRINGRGTRAIVSRGRLYLCRAGRRVLVRRLTGPHLRAALRKLHSFRKKKCPTA